MKLKTLALAAMMGTVFLPMAVQADELPNGPHVVISGQSDIDAMPDIVTLQIDVRVSAKEAAEAKKQADERVAQYFAFLTKNGVEKKDINAANLFTRPEYDFSKDGNSTLKGYRAVRQVQVTLRQLDNLNNILDGALKSGLNEIRSVAPGVANPQVWQQKARTAALADARDQAMALAEGLNSKLGSVYSIRYRALPRYQPVPLARTYKAASSAASAAVEQTYEQQTIHFRDQVDVVFELQPAHE